MPKKLKATKMRAKKKTKANVTKSEEVEKIMDMDGPVLMFPESDVKAVLTEAQLKEGVLLKKGKKSFKKVVLV